MDTIEEDRLQPDEFSKEETTLRLQEQANEKAALMNQNNTNQSPDPLEKIDATFRIPLLIDPINHEDPTKRKIDFTVRVGASLVRSEDSVVRIIQKQFGYTDDCTCEDSTEDTRTLRVDKENGGKNHRNAHWSKRRSESRRGSYQISTQRSYITGETPLARFQRLAHSVQILSSICRTLKGLVKTSATEMLSAVQMYLHIQEDVNKLLAFNPLTFTMVMPSAKGDKLKQLLQKLPSHRTAKDIKLILAYIRGHASIRDYPADVQIHMCHCMLYQRFEDRCILLKQGHPPTAFYFVISGSLFVNIEDVNPNTGKKFTRTVSELGAGDCFGELALLSRITRTATIICKTTVELLVVFREDFDKIIRQPLIRQRLGHIQFCQSLVLFEDFPCDIFATQPDDFFFQYIPEDTVLVHDSRECKYLIVIKAGKCTLVAPFDNSVLNKSNQRPSSSTRDLERAFPYYVEMRKMNLSRRPHTGSVLEKTASELRDSLDVGLLTGVVDKQGLERSGEREAKDTERRPPPLLKSRTLSNFFDKVEKERRMSTTEEGEDTDNPFWAVRLKGPSYRQLMTKKRGSSKGIPRTKTPQKMERLDFLRENKAYAQVAELKQGEVFGLESLVHRPSSSLSLVSHGAECVFISKKLFLKEANIKTLRVVSDMVMSYPSQVFIREHVAIHRDWIKYKRQLVNEVLTRYAGS